MLLSEDGGAFFVGTAKRGEDGDASAPWKGRRAPKPVKPKKMTKMDAVTAPVVSVIANSGTSALITRDGAVYMFGKVRQWLRFGVFLPRVQSVRTAEMVPIASATSLV